MFGYLIPQGTYLTNEERAVWQKSHCGICMSFKKFGNSAKLCANYDFTFLNIFFHAYFNKNQDTKNKKCFYAKFQNIEYFVPDEISDDIAKKGVVLLWFMHLDKVVDKEKDTQKVMATMLLKKAYKKCLVTEKDFVAALKKEVENQTELEKNFETDLYKISLPTANMLKAFANLITNNDKIVADLFFYIGQWIYLMDAMDDLNKDFKNKKFNPLLYGKNFQGDKLQFVVMNKKTLFPVLTEIADNIKNAFLSLPTEKQNNICKNVLVDSIQNFLGVLFKR